MANPRKRKSGKQIGAALAGGAGASESDFTAAQIENLLKLAQRDHKSDGRFVQGSTPVSGTMVGSGRGIGVQLLDEASGLETMAEMAGGSRMNLEKWQDNVKRYMIGTDTTLEGMTVGNPATAVMGVLHDPSGPDAKFVSKLDDVSNSTERSFFIKPTGWVTSKSLVFFCQNANSGSATAILTDATATQTLKIVQGDGNEGAFATDALDTTGYIGAGGDSTITISVANALGGEGDATATKILLDFSATTSPSAGANQIAIGCNGLTDPQVETLLQYAINGGTHSKIARATSGVGATADGVKGVTASSGSAPPKITLKLLDAHGASGNTSSKILMSGGGHDIVDVEDFTGGVTDDTVLQTWTGLAAAGQTHTVAHSTANDANGVEIRWDNENNIDLTENAGWHLCWKMT